jgi:hypothetical protein
MPLKEITIHQIDIHNTTVVPVDKDQYGQDLNNYLNGLIEIVAQGSGRSFTFERDTTEIRALIPKIIANENFAGVAAIAANRLLSKEQEAQKNIDKLKKIEIQKGIVVQAVIVDGSKHQYVICKADHSEFLKDEDYKLTKGLPIKKKVFKAFVVTFLPTNHIESVVVYDTNTTMAKYWWQSFLELTEVYTDKHNTTTAFNAMDKEVFTKMKKKHPQDYMHLRNSMVRYFRANEDFDMKDFLDNAIGDYKPYDQELKVVQLKEIIKTLPATKKFDEKFSILREEVTARFLNKVPLTAQIDLHIKEDVPNIEKIITTETDQDGTKYVKIQSDIGYTYFNELKQKKKK